MSVASTIHTFTDSLPSFAVSSVVFVILCLSWKFIYNVFFHPLRSFPGPLSHAMSRIPYLFKLSSGTLQFDLLNMHKKYGDVVRIAPNELAFSHPGAWKDIMGAHLRKEEELPKYLTFYRPLGNRKDPVSIISADREKHALLRRALSPGFSEKSMRQQEALIRQYLDSFIVKLRELGGGGTKSLDLMEWYNCVTFDIIGDLTYGESFGCIENAYLHPFVKLMLTSGRVGTFLQSAGYLPPLLRALVRKIPKSGMEVQLKIAKEKLARRMAVGNDRPDLIQGLLKKKDEMNMSVDGIAINCRLLLIGGSETTATLLSGVTFLLLTNPNTLEKLTAEVRSNFKNESEITINSVNRLSYMLACLDEALRVYPPVAIGLPRVVNKGGCSIIGQFVPEDTVVAIHHWSAYHDERHFTDPFAYHPERFLGDPKFANDKRDMFQPFNVGPRSCIGRSLAYAEMRVILALIIYNFDMKLAPESADWIRQQKVFMFYTKGPLNVFLTPVQR
ncbi:hypothetical protein PABG_05447 [Paracoccidioides brasiliensis Pb03]|nr:hypothetical protein PABG_05447 [Paracoccidioides brasiliensis Pb03]